MRHKLLEYINLGTGSGTRIAQDEEAGKKYVKNHSYWFHLMELVEENPIHHSMKKPALPF